MSTSVWRGTLTIALVVALGCGDDGRVEVDGGGITPSDGGGLDGGVSGSDGGGSDGGGSDAALADGGGSTGTSPLVDPSCVDGQYTETLPNASASIDDVAFTSLSDYVDAVLDRRYPVGAALVRGGRTNTLLGQDCDVYFGGGASSASAALDRLDTIVHECAHLYDSTLSSFSSHGYAITDSLTLYGERGDTSSRGGDTFARSRLLDDSYAALRPPCNGSSATGCDSYADIYLDGDPDDGNFDSGDQGFNLLHEETVQYVNSLASAYAFHDQLSSGIRTSARDGILTFLWYTMRYLRMARTSYPSAYTAIAEDADWRELILTTWGRAWLYLELTEDIPQLQLDDQLDELVRDEDLLFEIAELRRLHGCG